jgi:MoaA/NifB/PqqE/SkfB family radical SAM enzyme
VKRIVLELTDRCNLSCLHCFDGRHGGHDDLPLSVLDAVLKEARACGFENISFTGGDPTVHRDFARVLAMTHSAGYHFGIVTNGWNFRSVYRTLLPFRDLLSGITFSLDGADAETHDRLRGRGSFRRVMQAFSVCVVHGLQFTVNTVLTTLNCHQIEPVARLAAQLGSAGLRFGHLIPTATSDAHRLGLSDAGKISADAEIRDLQKRFPIPIAIAPGYYTADPFPCAPLQGDEINIDCRGCMTKCCHLSGQTGGAGPDVFGSILESGFPECLRRLIDDNQRFRRAKLQHFAAGPGVDADFFPCLYCSSHYRKVQQHDPLVQIASAGANSI